MILIDSKMTVMRKLLLGSTVAVLIQGCATTTPAPVTERAPPSQSSSVPRPAAKPVAPRVTPPAEAQVVVKPLSPAASDAAPVAAGMHAVRPGDTLFSIAKANKVTVRDLAAWNNIEDPASIRVGQQLRLTPPEGAAVEATPVPVASAPTPSAVEIKPIDIPPSAPVAGAGVKPGPLAQRVPYSDQAWAQMSKTAPPPADKPEAPVPPTGPARSAGDVEWAWPVQGKVVANFNESSNKGIAIAGSMGQRIQASAAGRVIFSGNGPRGLGQMVVVRHNATYLSVYAHNSRLLVKEGQTVTRGQAIAEMGNSDADRVKLHFEIRAQGKPVDPLRFLPES